MQVLNKKLCRGGAVPVEAFMQFHRDSWWTDLAMDDKGTPHAVGGSSSPMRARTAMRVPGDIWCWVLLCVGDVIVCCCGYCRGKMQIQGSALLTKGISQMDAA